MKPSLRKFLYGTLTLFCLGFAVFIFFNGKSKPTVPELRERKGALAKAPEWPKVKATVNGLLTDLQAKPNDPKTKLLLAKEFMQEARATGDYSYYNKTALDLINEVLAQQPDHFEAGCLKALVLLSQHRFAEGKALTEALVKKNPHNSFIYGLLTDANVELGDYAAAVETADKMVSTRPDIRSYSRVSYLRELHGDMPGAQQAIEMAVKAGYPGNEDTEWARMVQAHLYEDLGDLDHAEGAYNIALQERPGYPFALAGLGRIARYRKDYPAAIRYMEQAKDVMTDIGFFEELIDVYRLNGDQKKADEYARITLDALEADNITASKNPDAGHYSDRDIALIYLKTHDFAKAEAYARIEQQRRPNNIDACETLAWALYKQGKFAEAVPLMMNAMRTHSQVPERLVHAGLIMLANGQAEGSEMVKKGLTLKPYMDEELAAEARTKIGG